MSVPPESMLGLGSPSNANVAKIAIEQRKKKTDVVEPQVISEDLLIDGVEEPIRPEGEAWHSIDFPKVTSMRLSFQNIIEISNLTNFNSLTTLRLDNNIIDKIENLGHLVQLTWLDLSFNNIREIEGLEGLINLTDLSLYNNQIEDIKGFENNMKMNILSLGHNKIKELKQIDKLRKLPNLRCVCLEGNKVCDDDSFRQHVLAYLTNLKYLDYKLIDRKQVAQAAEGYQLDELTELREEEEATKAKERAEAEKHAAKMKLAAAFLDCTDELFEELFSKEVEPEQVTVLQCYGQLKEDYRDRLLEDIKNLRSWIEEKNSIRVKKVNAFETAIDQAEQESEEEAFQMVRDFRSRKKKVLAQLDREEHHPGGKVDAMLDKLKDQLNNLGEHLMANELALQESIEEAINTFDSTVSDLIKGMSEKGSDFFRRLEEHEKLFFTSLSEGASSETESFTQNQDTLLTDSDANANKAKFLGNRDDMNLACTNFNEAHNTLIQNKEDYMQNQMTTWKKTFFEKHVQRQYNRNRQRITDIKKVIDECHEEISSAGEAADYDDDQDNVLDPYGR